MQKFGFGVPVRYGVESVTLLWEWMRDHHRARADLTQGVGDVTTIGIFKLLLYANGVNKDKKTPARLGAGRGLVGPQPV